MRYNIKQLLRDIWNKFPYIVWRDEEIDIQITFLEPRLNPNNPVGSLYDGELPEIEQKLNGIGIQFDRGIGLNGRDWEWDYSLYGPISVKFKGRAQNPGNRR